jgi:hypothetical protein
LVLSTTTDRPDAGDSEMSCPAAVGARGWSKQVLTDMVMRAGKAFAEERRLAGRRQPDQDPHSDYYRSRRMAFDEWFWSSRSDISRIFASPK